jgi:hypothetical protein
MISSSMANSINKDTTNEIQKVTDIIPFLTGIIQYMGICTT